MAVALIILFSAILVSGSIIYATYQVKNGDLSLPRKSVAKKAQSPDVQSNISVVEMTPERFRELPYRKRMSQPEAAIWYEKKNEERLREAAKPRE